METVLSLFSPRPLLPTTPLPLSLSLSLCRAVVRLFTLPLPYLTSLLHSVSSSEWHVAHHYMGRGIAFFSAADGCKCVEWTKFWPGTDFQNRPAPSIGVDTRWELFIKKFAKDAKLKKCRKWLTTFWCKPITFLCILLTQSAKSIGLMSSFLREGGFRCLWKFTIQCDYVSESNMVACQAPLLPNKF